jgi:hypothetical protein
MKVAFTFIAVVFLFSCDDKTNARNNGRDKVSGSQAVDNLGTVSPGMMSNKDRKNTEFASVELAGDWVLEEGGFPDQHLRFSRKEGIVSYSFFAFQPDGKMDFVNTHSGDCPVGEFAMIDGKWIWGRDTITLELRGLIWGVYWYWWKIHYKIKEHTIKTLKLEVIEIIKRKELNPDHTWEELIAQ